MSLNDYHESEAHNKLKKLAYKFLENLNFTDIKFDKHVNVLISYLVPDVLGTLGETTVGIECGRISEKRLNKYLEYMKINKNFKLYILPYGGKEPYLYEEFMKVCSCCGNCIGNKEPYFDFIAEYKKEQIEERINEDYTLKDIKHISEN